MSWSEKWISYARSQGNTPARQHRIDLERDGDLRAFAAWCRGRTEPLSSSAGATVTDDDHTAPSV